MRKNLLRAALPHDELHCGHCDAYSTPRITVRAFADATEHLEAKCADCGSWLKWLPQIEPWLSLVHHPSSFEQAVLL